MRNKTAAVVVTYNRKELLKKCIGRLLESDTPCDILIIDNLSTDGTREMMESVAGERVFYYNTGANLGGAGGFNFGIRQAMLDGYEYAWIMDDDCMVHRDTLTEFFNASEKLGGDFGFLSSVVRWKDGNICTMNLQRHPLTKPLTDLSKELAPVTLASFVSLFIPRAVIMELGLPIKEFFIWTDDWEYTRRISKKYKCFVAGKSVVTHESASNIGASIVSDSRERLERYRYLYRNDVYLYRREGLRGFCYEVVRLGGHILRVLFYSKGDRLVKIGIILGGTLRGLKFMPEIEYVEKR